jgi:tetratricopeptide (TPR) repeat protein
MIHVLNDGHEQELATLAVESISRHVPGHGIPEYWLVQRRLMLHADRCRQLLDEVADDDDRGWSSHNLGDLYADQGRLKEAEAMYERALQGYEKALGKDGIQASVPFLNTVTNLGHLYVATQRKTKAKECYERALTGVRKVFGNGSDRAKELESLLYGLDR